MYFDEDLMKPGLANYLQLPVAGLSWLGPTSIRGQTHFKVGLLAPRSAPPVLRWGQDLNGTLRAYTRPEFMNSELMYQLRSSHGINYVLLHDGGPQTLSRDQVNRKSIFIQTY